MPPLDKYWTEDDRPDEWHNDPPTPEQIPKLIFMRIFGVRQDTFHFKFPRWMDNIDLVVDSFSRCLYVRTMYLVYGESYDKFHLLIKSMTKRPLEKEGQKILKNIITDTKNKHIESTLLRDIFPHIKFLHEPKDLKSYERNDLLATDKNPAQWLQMQLNESLLRCSDFFDECRHSRYFEVETTIYPSYLEKLEPIQKALHDLSYSGRWIIEHLDEFERPHYEEFKMESILPFRRNVLEKMSIAMNLKPSDRTVQIKTDLFCRAMIVTAADLIKYELFYYSKYAQFKAQQNYYAGMPPKNIIEACTRCSKIIE